MNYEYTNFTGAEIAVEIYFDNPLISVSDGDNASIEVPREDAPAVALAILEAAGIAELDPEDRLSQSRAPELQAQAAVTSLKRWQSRHAEQAEREAEDAKVREFVESIPGVSILDESEDHWRHLYRAARDHFQQDGNLPAPGFLAGARADFKAHAHKELAQPATIDGPEDIRDSHRRRQWVDQDGLIWSWDYKHGNWGWRTKNGKYRNVDIPDSFPWTEVAR